MIKSKSIQILRKLFLGLDKSQISLKRYGSEYGGWFICTDNDFYSNVLISAEVGEDISFEIE